MSSIVDHTILAKTRAEEHEADVWGKFYIPPYFHRLGLMTATKSTYIIGKRGCGKTMLLKYLDYHTAFSQKRNSISESELDHIGIYWRVDTHFCNSMNYRGLQEHEWIPLFDSYFALVIGIEIIRAMRSISTSSLESISSADFNSLKFLSAKDFHVDFPTSPDDLEAFLEGKRRAFTTWISNKSSMNQPILPPGRSFIDAMIADVKKTARFEKACFYIYIDEVENLVTYQRRVLNSFLKHSQRPFIVSFTSKELSDENGTTGSESINATHDYRLLSLDELWEESERNVFFAEVFLANLDLAAKNENSDLLKAVRSLDSIAERQEAEYKQNVLETIRKKFPSISSKELATQAVNEPRILKILLERINKALMKRASPHSASEFSIFTECADALVVVPALLNRPKVSTEKVLSELQLYLDRKSGSFESGWIHNNLFGSLLELYRPYGGVCPIYSGFDTFCTMANKNLRHFLILCYKALEISELKEEDNDIFSTDTQARAAYEAAEKLIREIKTFGAQGDRLRNFVLRLGNIFRALQAQPSMSEPEQNQFTINSGQRSRNEEESKFIAEAMKYAILIEQLETKTKGRVGDDIVDYQMNPIYAPYFQISYRRKRKIELSVEEFHLLSSGTEDEYRELSAKLTKNALKPTVVSNPNKQMDLWQ